MGLALSWLALAPILAVFTFVQSKRHIGLSAAGLIAAIWPGMSASAAMALLVYAAGTILPEMSVYWRLPILIATGGLAYGLLLMVLGRETLAELVNFVVRRKVSGDLAAA